MQCGLINHRAGQAGVAVVIQGDGQVAEPGAPAFIQVSAQSNFVPSGLVWPPSGLACLVYDAPRGLSSFA